MRRSYALAALAIAVLAACASAQIVWNNGEDFDRVRRQQTVVAVKDALALVNRELIADEIGETINSKSSVVREFVAGDLCVRKDFQVADPTTGPAVLSVFATSTSRAAGELPTLLVTFNGTELAYTDVHTRVRPYGGTYKGDFRTGQKHKSYWRGGWQEIPIPAKLIRKGLNTAVIRARGKDRWRLMIEPSRAANRSARSLDGGRTWDFDRLSSRGNLNGEYLVRLLLTRYPAAGWVESDVVDLWAKDAAGLALPIDVTKVAVTAETDLPAGTQIEWFARIGPTPLFDPKTWTPWTPAVDLAAGKSFGETLSGRVLRFAQWRAVLRTAKRTVTPKIKSVTLTAVGVAIPIGKPLKVTLVTIDQPAHVAGSFAFTHGRRGKRMKLLETMNLPRKKAEGDEKYTLEEVIAKGDTEIKRVTRIAAYIAKETNVGNHKPGRILRDTPDYDALLTLDLAHKVTTHGMCVNEAALFTQLANALGWPARRVFWSHAIAEVWLNSHKKWMAIDASGGFCYVFKDGSPASFTDIALNAEKTDTVKIVQQYRSGKRGKSLDRRGAMFFTRFWMPLRGNYLEAPGPGELGQGRQSFKYNGYLRWNDPKKEPLPWFDFYSSRNGDFNWTCNGTQIHLARTASPTTLNVNLSHDMPNFKRFEILTAGGKWQATDARFQWNLIPGKNLLEVRALNQWQAEAVDSGDAKRAAKVLGRIVPIVSKALVQAEAAGR